MNVRKIVAGLAAVTMLATFSAQAVFAADTVAIKADEVKANKGKEFTLDISLADIPAQGISAMEFAVTYDAKAVTVTEVTPGAVTNNGVDAAEKFDGVTVFEVGTATEGLVTITYSTGLSDAQYCITDSGVFATIKGTVKDDAADGTYPVKITAIPRETVEGSGTANAEIKAGYIGADRTVAKYSTTVTNGAVIVGDGGDVTPSEETPSEEKPSEEKPSEETPSDQKPSEETPSEETPSDQKPSEETPSDDKPDDNPSSAVKATMYGDANCDGEVDIMDVIAVNKFLLGSGKLTDQGKANANVDDSKSVDTTDSLNILKCVVAMIQQSEFPIK